MNKPTEKPQVSSGNQDKSGKGQSVGARQSDKHAADKGNRNNPGKPQEVKTSQNKPGNKGQ